MRPGELAFEVGDGSDHGGPGLGLILALPPIVADRVELQGAGVAQTGDAT